MRGFFKAQIVLTNNQSVGGCISIYLTGRYFLKNKMNEHVIGQLCFYLLVAVDFFNQTLCLFIIKIPLLPISFTLLVLHFWYIRLPHVINIQRQQRQDERLL